MEFPARQATPKRYIPLLKPSRDDVSVIGSGQ
jgi:hypothetical protein